MCGFIAYKNNTDLSPGQILDVIDYRGLPGFHGTENDGDHTFSHVALPFVNLDPEVATQPLTGFATPSLFVGEVFNYDTLFATDGDYVNHVFHNEGLDGFHRFDGFWSFITKVNGSLIGVTDYLAQKPLYYRTDQEAMASEIDVLRELGPTTLDEVFISNTMKWGYSPDPRTPYNEIKQVPPGCYVYEGQIYEYWDWKKVGYGDLHSDMRTAVERRLGGQRDLSVLLSGGLDSTIIYGILQELGRDVTAIHVDNGEESFAGLVSNDFVSVSLDSVTDEESVAIHQSPVDLGSVKPQIAMARKLAELGFHCVLTGDGADELFGGYNRAKEYDSQGSDVFAELPYYHLPKLDRTMMRSTIELRAPFLAPYIVKRALETPYSDRNGEKKVLKRAFADIVPQEILDRDKHPLKTDKIRKNPLDQRTANVRIFRDLVES
jgi:asparagine synthase (glutamine-hydrolysing)